MNDIASKIRTAQNRDGMLRRALERLIQLYTDKSHFVFELLQNAEDAEAKSIEFIQYPDRLEVLHDGKPFTSANLKGLCDIGKSDKVDNLNQIGEFGVGFKSVFGICDTVRLYSAPYHFRAPIDSDAVPFAVQILDFTRPEDIPGEPVPIAYTTRYVFPYVVGQSFSGFKTLKALNDKISDKLQNFGATTLLFMKNLETIKYQIKLGGAPITGEYRLRKEELNDHCLLVAANDGSKDGNIYYLKFSRRIPKYAPRTVDIAFPIRINEDNTYQCIKAKDPYVSVYFPTGTVSYLDFIVQGPYRTTPDRSSIPADDEDNIYLVQETTKLLRQSILELKEMGKLNMSFVKVLPVSRQRFEYSSLFLPLFDTVRELFRTAAVIPSKSGRYVFANYAKIARGEHLASLFTDELLTRLINGDHQYYWLPTYLTETSPEYGNIYKFMTDEVGIKVIQVDSLRQYFESNPKFLPEQSDDWLVSLYGLFEKTPSLFSKTSYTANMVTAKIIKTTTGDFVAPFRREGESYKPTYKPNIFVPSPKIHSADMYFVDQGLYQRCPHFFKDILHLEEANEYECVIHDIKKRYEKIVIFNAEQLGEQHIEDIKFLLKYVANEDHKDEVLQIIRETLLLRCTDGTMRSTRYWRILLPVTKEGIDAEAYYRNLRQNVYFVDLEYYEEHGIIKQTLITLGVHNSLLVDEYTINGYYDVGQGGNLPGWWTTGDFRWELSVDALEDAVKYISENPTANDSILKSQIIMKLLIANESHLCGRLNVGGKRFSDQEDAKCKMIRILLNEDHKIDWDGRWVFTESGELVRPGDISKHDISSSIYGTINPDSIVFKLLFKPTEDDVVNDLKKIVPQEKLDAYVKSVLRQRYGISLEFLDKQFGSTVREEEPEAVETPEAEEKPAFPTMNVRSWDSLRKHAAEMLVYANPVRYEKRVRSIRVSDRRREKRAYLQNMYRPEGNISFWYACQLCHEACSNFETAEIFPNPEVELDPMNLCLCPSCAAKYRSLRSDETIMSDVRMAFLSKEDADIETSDHVAVPLGDDDELWFTQTHFAEIRELLRLTDEAKANTTEPSPEAQNSADAASAAELYRPNVSIQEQEKPKQDVENTGHMENIRRLKPLIERSGRLQKCIAAGFTHTVGLKSDGTVVAVGYNKDGRCDVSKWTDIVDIAVGIHHTVGLKSDGTVLAVGSNSNYAGWNYTGQCDTSDWTDIIAIAAGSAHTVGLQSDGTVEAVGPNDAGQCDVSGWTDIVAVAAGGKNTVGLKFDGTVAVVGRNDYGQCGVLDWTNIIAVAAGDKHTVGLKSDGTVVAVGRNDYGQCGVLDWTDIIAIAAGGLYTVGLKSDGTVVAVGSNGSGGCDVSGWTDIVAVAAGDHHTVGLKSDGTVVATGHNPYGECKVSEWKLFNNVDMLEEFREARNVATARRHRKRIAAEERSCQEEARNAAEERPIVRLRREKKMLETELANLHGLFTGKRRRKITSRLAEIDRALNNLMWD